MKKEKWDKPKLIVLVRGEAEAVLAGCKGDASTPSSGSGLGLCEDVYCGNCSAQAAS